MGARLVRAAAAGAILLATSAARAQAVGDMALSQFEPSVAGDPFFGLPAPFIGGHLAPRFAVVLDHASQPLVLSTDAASSALVSSQTWLNVSASFALWDRLLIGALLPVVVAQGGDSPLVQGKPVPSPNAAALGDLRVSLRVRIFGDELDPFQVSGGALLHVPTGSAGVFAGEGALRLTPQLVLGGRFSRFVYSASVGMVVRGSQNPSALTYGAGFAALLWKDRIQVGPEVVGSTPVQEARTRLANVRSLELEDSTNLELMLGVRGHLPLGFTAGVGAGFGLTDAIGTPAFRVVGTLGWGLGAGARPTAEAEKVDDADEDGIGDSSDACPYAFGPKAADAKRTGCPVLDSDEDGVPDHEDACPEAPGDAASGASAKGKGCPEAAPPAPG